MCTITLYRDIKIWYHFHFIHISYKKNIILKKKNCFFIKVNRNSCDYNDVKALFNLIPV